MNGPNKQRISIAASWMTAAGVLIAVSCSRETPPASEPRPIEEATLATGVGEPALHSVTIRKPSGPPRVVTGATNHHGEAVTVSCSSCHATTTPNREIRRAEQLVQFHQGLRYAHGELSCLSCHNEQDYDTLRLADGSSVAYVDTMTLCGQCHGPQLRDYDRGLHGGMTGHWDLTRGPRTRNNCIHCHDPHAPDFPLVQPVFPPRDRMPVVRDPAREANH